MPVHRHNHLQADTAVACSAPSTRISSCNQRRSWCNSSPHLVCLVPHPLHHFPHIHPLFAAQPWQVACLPHHEQDVLGTRCCTLHSVAAPVAEDPEPARCSAGILWVPRLPRSLCCGPGAWWTGLRCACALDCHCTGVPAPPSVPLPPSSFCVNWHQKAWALWIQHIGLLWTWPTLCQCT